MACFAVVCVSGDSVALGGERETKAPEESGPDAARPKLPAIDVSEFRDCTHHWRKIRDSKRAIDPLPDQASYSPAQVERIVGNILLFQRANGGWPKNYDMLAILTPEQIAAVKATRNHTDTSFDNYNVYSQVQYLAKAYSAGGDDAWRDACLRGFDFILAAQLDCGGFPQRYPNPSSYFAHITFNDGVTIGILNVLKDAADGLPHWKWLDDDRRRAAQQAVDRGVECILRCQIRAGDTLTGWCQQHDAKTFAAASARTFELASNCPQETTAIARFLMRFDDPDDRTVKAIEDAVEWLHHTKLTGIRVQRVSATAADYEFHSTDFDVIVVPDADAPSIWARHYEIGTDRPLFAGRDAVKRYALSEIERERRTGTRWYGRWPRSLLDREYPKWREKLPKQPKVKSRRRPE